MKYDKLLCCIAICATFFSCQNTDNESIAGLALSFDDRNVEEWVRLRPILKKYNTKATFYVTEFEKLTAKEIEGLRLLQKDGHEIGAHGALHVRSIDYTLAHGLDAYFNNEIEAELDTMQRAGFRPTSFAHPGGQQTWLIDRLLLNKHFVLLRDVSMTERIVYGIRFGRSTAFMDEIYHRHKGNARVNALIIDRYSHIGWEELQRALIRAADTHTTVMMFGHLPLFEASKEKYGFDVARLDSLLSTANALQLKTVTMSELVEVD